MENMSYCRVGSYADRQERCERPERDFPAVIPENPENSRPLSPDELDFIPAPEEA